MLAAIAKGSQDMPSPAPWWRRSWALPVLVPLTAGAAAVALWVASPVYQRSPKPSLVAEDRAADANKSDAPIPSGRLETTSPPIDALRAPSASAPLQKRATPAENQALRQQEERKTPEERKTQATNGAGRDDREGRRKLEASAESVGAVTAPAASPTNQALEAGSSPAATSRAAAPAATPPPAAPAAKALDAASPARLRAFSNQSIEFTASIASPDPSIRWRIGRAGSIQYSSNGGVSWEPTATGVSVDLSAGSSPAPLVCWVVGRAGTVMLTVDGRRWQRVAFPENVDVIAVEASDARTALVRTAAGRAFRTADGGATWTPVQDF
jgi:hypothetical protein